MARIKIRQARYEDIEVYLRLQSKRWSEANAATKDQLEKRFKVYPEGMLVAERSGEIVGMVYAMRISDYDYNRSPSWYEVTNNGYCDNHAPDGPIIFGVDLSTAPGVGAAAGDKLLVGIAQIAIKHNIKWCMLGGRMPGYHLYKDKMSADEYLVAKGADGKPLDPQVRFYTSVEGLKAVKALPDYFDDPDSCDYGVLLRWRNPLFGLPLLGVWSRLFPILFRIEEQYVRIVGWFSRLSQTA
jgi:hypothetical protein